MQNHIAGSIQNDSETLSEVIVGHVSRIGSQTCVKIVVQDQTVEALVDTGAQVTIISERVYQKMLNPPPCIGKVKLRMANGDISQIGKKVGPVRVKLGKRWYAFPVYVARLDAAEDMLLGYDILESQGHCLVDVIHGVLHFDGQVIQGVVKRPKSDDSEATVSVKRRVIIPPNSVKRVSCSMSKELPDYVFEPSCHLKVIAPKTFRSGKTDPIVCLINTSDYQRIIPRGTRIGKAFAACTVESTPVKNQHESQSVSPNPDSQDARLLDDHSLTKNRIFSNDPVVGHISMADRKAPVTSNSSVPEHIADMYQRSTGLLSPPQKDKLSRLLSSYNDVFASTEFDLGNFKVIEHSIVTGDARPVKQRMRRTPAGFADEEKGQLEKMLKSGVIQESTSEWASAPVLIRKRDGSVRWCIDYRALNDVTVKDLFPLPLVDDCLETLSGSVWFSKLDANSAYWQIKINESDRRKTAFITKYGLFEHVRMGFGLCNAPATYARVMNLVLRGLTWNTVLAFLDDILVLGESFEEHLSNLEDVFKRFREKGLKLKPKKCVLFQNEVEFLGRIVSSNSISMSQTDIQAVLDWPTPTCSKEVESFCGLANYHRNFIKSFSALSRPLYSVVGKKNYRWDPEQQVAFDTLKQALVEPPVLALPNHHDPFVLDTDASDLAIGAELIQLQEGEEKVIAYGSFAFTKEQRKYCVTRKELLAVVRFTRQYRHYLLGKEFTVRTDHASLIWLLRFKEPQGQLARWMEELSQFHMTIVHRKGREHTNADALSRMPVVFGHWDGKYPEIRLEDLPCGGCKFCKKAHLDWGPFLDAVDDAIPLAWKPVSSSSTGGAKNSAGLHQGNEVGDQLSAAAVNVVVPTSLSSDDQLEALCQFLAGPPQTVTATANSDEPALTEMVSKGDSEGFSPSVNCAQLSNSCPLFVSESSSANSGAPQTSGGPNIENSSIFPQTRLLWDPGNFSDGVCVTLSRNSEEYVAECFIGATKKDPKTSQNPPDPPTVPVTGNDTSWGFTLTDIRDVQAREPTFQFILEWLKSQTIPEEAELMRSCPANKYYWLHKEQFLLVDEVIYFSDHKDDERKLLVPHELRNLTMTWHHSIPSAGHQGVNRTKYRLKEKYIWYGMGKDVAKFVLECEICNQHKKSARTGRCPLTSYYAGAPMEKVHIDFLGPLTKTPRGNLHILVMVDQFTKWVECVPLPSQTAEVTAKAAVDHFFSRFGTPFSLISDQGRNFESQLFAELCKVLEIRKARTTPYRPSANGQVERYNRTLMDALRCYVGKVETSWDIHLPQITGALRSAVNRQTGFTANKLMLGREINIPASLMFPHTQKEYDDVDEFVADLVQRTQQAHEIARTTLKTSTKRMKRNYDLRVSERSYKVGDAIYLLDTAVLKGKCKKLSPPWKGPGVIVTKVSSYIYRIKFRNSLFVVNHDRLKPCHDRVLPQWIIRWKEDPKDSPAGSDDKLYCVCRKKYEGRFMIMCDYCNEWYHGSCVNITVSDSESIGKYKCKDCLRRKAR